MDITRRIFVFLMENNTKVNNKRRGHVENLAWGQTTAAGNEDTI